MADDNRKVVCTSFELSGDGSQDSFIYDFCGPLSDLADQLLDDTAAALFTMPAPDELLAQYSTENQLDIQATE